MKHTLTSVVIVALLTASCTSQPSQKAFINRLDGNDSVAMRVDAVTIDTFHSQRLGVDIPHPAFLIHQEPTDGSQAEVFMASDISLMVRSDSVSTDKNRQLPSQQYIAMGAEIVKTTDNYSILRGYEENYEYYVKIIDDSTRIFSIVLRYDADHEEATEPLREWLDAFDW